MHPLTAAKEWARRHPEYAGALEVTRRNERGRLVTDHYYVADGTAAPQHDWQCQHQPKLHGNGLCWICGRVHLDNVVRIGILDDGYVEACDTCVEVNQLGGEYKAGLGASERYLRKAPVEHISIS